MTPAQTDVERVAMREQIAQIIEDTYDVSIKRELNNIDTITDAILAALPAMIEAGIADLIWLGGGGRYHAGDYVIEDVSLRSREVRRLLRASFGTTYIADFAGDRPIESAKDAANAHHRATLMAAIGMGVE